MPESDVLNKPLRREEFATRSIAGETILVPIKGNAADLDSIYTLNQVGTRIWQLIDGRASVAQIADAIHHEFDVGKEQALQDVLDFLASLQAARLIQTLPESKN